MVAIFVVSGQSDPPMPEDVPDVSLHGLAYFGLTLLPNVLLSLLPDHVIMHTAWPQGPTRTRVVCDWLFDPTEVAKPDFDPADTVAAFDITNRQDWDVCQLTQPSMSSKAYEHGGVFVSNELHITAFRDMVLERLGDL